MAHKNKKQFDQNRLIFMAGGEAPKLAEGELAEVKKHKEEEGPELDTKSLVDQSNSVIGKYKAQLDELPPKFNAMLHDEIVKYFLASPGRFEKDEKKGLSAAEFSSYRSAMVAKVGDLMKEYAPTEEDIKQMQEAKKKAKETISASEKLKPIEAKDISESPGAISDLPTLDKKFSQYNNWNAALQQEAVSVMDQGAEVQKAYAAFKKARDGISSFKKFKAYLWPENDAERIALQDKVNAAKTKLDDTIKKYQAAKTKLEKYGAEMGEASNKLKEARVKERDDKIAEMEKGEKESKESKEKKQKQYEAIEKHQKALQGERDNLAKYGEEAAEGKSEALVGKQKAEAKKTELSKGEAAMKAALARVEDALKSKDLSDEERNQLEETRKQLQEKLGEVSTGVRAVGLIVEGKSAEYAKYSDAEKAAAQKSVNLQKHLEDQVSPALTSLDSSIATLESAKLKFATTKEQVIEHYDKMFKAYDSVDEAVDNAVLKNNLANEKMLGQLQATRKSMDSIDLRPPSGVKGAFEATAGVVLGTIGGGISTFGEFCLGQSKWLYDTLEEHKASMGPVSYFFARAGTEVVGVTIGVAGGLLEMGGGLVSMVAHPIDLLTGMGALIGRDTATGQFSGKMAGHAWSEMGKALISYEDFKHGRFGVGVGKVFANIVTTVTGAGAVGSGGKAAQAVYTAARAAGKGVARSIGEAAIIGGKEAAVFVGKEAKAGAKAAAESIAAAPGKLAKAVSAAPGKLAEGAKAVSEGLAGAAAKAGEIGVAGVARATVRIGKSGIEFVGKSFQAVGEGAAKGAKGVGETLAARVEKIWGGKKFEDVRMRKMATTELKLVEELGSKAEKYEEYQQAMQKLREENPGISEADLGLKMAKEHPSLVADAKAYESNMKKLEAAQAELEKALMDSLHDPAKKEEMAQAVVRKRDAQKAMADSAADFQQFRKKLEKKDPAAMKAAEDFQKALASGDAEQIAAAKAAHPEFSKAFSYLEAQYNFEKASVNTAQIRLAEKVEDNLSALLKYRESIASMHAQKPNVPISVIEKELEKLDPSLVASAKQCQADLRALRDLYPESERFNRIISRKGEVLIGFDENGTLRFFKEHQTVQDTMPKMNKLSASQVEEIGKLYHQYIEATRFQSGGMTLEFMKFVRRAREKNPKLTLKEALAMFNLDSAAIVEKYGGGNCFALSNKFAEILKKKFNVDANVIGNRGFNATLQLDGQEWFQALEHVNRSHGSVSVHYIDEAGRTRYLHFEMGIGRSDMSILDDFSSLRDGANASGAPYVHPEYGIANLDSSIMKSQLQTRNALYFMGDVEMGQFLAIDLLKGNMYIRKGTGLAKAVEASAGRFSININDILRSPSSMVSLTIDGVPVTMTRLESAYLFLETARKKLKLPPDFTENVMYLLTHRDEYYQSFMLSQAGDAYAALHH